MSKMKVQQSATCFCWIHLDKMKNLVHLGQASSKARGIGGSRVIRVHVHAVWFGVLAERLPSPVLQAAVKAWWVGLLS